MGFILNPYEKDVGHKFIYGHQCTVAFYVDDNKISHENPEVVSSVLKEISNHFGKLFFTCTNKYNFHCIKIKVKDEKVCINMKQQMEEAIKSEVRVYKTNNISHFYICVKELGMTLKMPCHIFVQEYPV